jgi:hypothetical protein
MPYTVKKKTLVLHFLKFIYFNICKKNLFALFCKYDYCLSAVLGIQCNSRLYKPVKNRLQIKYAAVPGFRDTDFFV